MVVWGTFGYTYRNRAYGYIIIKLVNDQLKKEYAGERGTMITFGSINYVHYLRVYFYVIFISKHISFCLPESVIQYVFESINCLQYGETIRNVKCKHEHVC
jgi:hypothetical protein